VDKQKDEAYLLVGNNKIVKCTHYDSNFEIKDSMTVARPEKEFESIAGVNKNDEFMSVFWINEDHNQLYQQHVDFKTRTASFAKKHSFDFATQKVIQTFSSNNCFYLLTITTNSNVLNLYTFDSNGKESVNKIDLGTNSFFNSDSESTTLFEVLKEKISGFDTAFELP
ncbi:MAG: hypothetical protein JNM09_32905, partial [Blastocatellia bacterium]|nr:hypothetical protein [Blastocatellia bacterium]